MGDASVETKVCCRCGKGKPTAEFWKEPRHRDGFASLCKTCFEEGRKAYRKANPEKALNQSLRDRFGITLDEYKAKLLQQRGVCAICGHPETAAFRDKIKMLSVDHNHKTGQIRGLLCDQCNRALGAAKEDPHILDSAIRYLMFWRNVNRPGSDEKPAG
jgi:hypothetical protein